MAQWRQRISDAAAQPLDTLLALIFLQWIAVMGSVVYNSYAARAFTGLLSFKLSDGWCDLATESIGRHCFGDFGLPFHAGLRPYESVGFPGSNSPLVNVLVSLFRALPYKWALLLYLTSFAVALLAAVLPSTRSLAPRDRIAIAVFGGLLSVGFLAALDRGNHVAYMAPLLLGLILGRSPKTRILCLSLLIGLKFWGVLFLIIVLQRKRYREAVIALALAMCASAVAMFVLSDDWTNGVKNMLLVVTSSELSKSVTPYSISMMGLIRRTACHTGPSSWCSTSVGTMPLLLLSIVILGALLLIAWYAMKQETWSSPVRYAPVVSIITLGLPEAGSYVLVLVVVLTALVAGEPSRHHLANPQQESSGLRLMTLFAIATTTAPIAAGFVDPSTSTFVRWQYIASPLVWAATIFWIACALGSSARSRLPK